MTTATDTKKAAAAQRKAEAIALWKDSKDWGDENTIKALLATIEEQLKTRGLSERNYKLVAFQMQQQGLNGSPYLHTRKFKGWLEAGRQVRKGEKSTLFSITWISSGGKEGDEESGRCYPKVTHLFHFDQTDPIEGAIPTEKPFPTREERAEAKPRAKRSSKGKTAGLAVIQNGLEVSENKDKGGIEIRFTASPSQDVREQLKSHGFRESKANGCWYIKATDEAKAFAYSLQA